MSPIRAALTALVIPLLGTPPAAAADAALCFGQAPTIVGAPSQSLTGTDGDDVIVTNGADRVSGLAGADRICVVGELRGKVDAGPGDDLVDTKEAKYGTRIKLGSGADTFVGGRWNDHVIAGDKDDVAAGPSMGVDRISTGGGRDEVVTGAGRDVDVANGDVIDLGASDDVVLVLGSSVPSLDGGGGWNGLRIGSTAGGAWLLDVGTGETSRDGVAMGPVVDFANISLFSLHWDELEFVGGPASEDLTLGNGRSGRVGDDGPVAVRMGGGGDNVWARSQEIGTIVGGPGNDWLRIDADKTTSPRSSLLVDLARGLFRLDDRVPTRFSGWERLSASEASHSTFNGDGRPNDLLIWGCDNTVRGRGGNDVLVNYACDGGGRQGSLILGGPGNDRLTGSVHRDRLIGGPGRDHALGGGGGDLCAVEIKEYCR